MKSGSFVDRSSRRVFLENSAAVNRWAQPLPMHSRIIVARFWLLVSSIVYRRSDAMKTSPHRFQGAALILALASLMSALLPHAYSNREPREQNHGVPFEANVS